MNTNKAALFLATLALFSVLSSGCAVHMAANAPDRKDLNVLAVGNHRDLIMAELGAPAVEKVGDDGLKYDIYKFNKGFTGSEKFFHAAGHGVMDVATLGLWEVVGTPSEGMSQKNEKMVKVIYNKDETAKQIIVLKEDWPELQRQLAQK